MGLVTEVGGVTTGSTKPADSTNLNSNFPTRNANFDAIQNLLNVQGGGGLMDGLMGGMNNTGVSLGMGSTTGSGGNPYEGMDKQQMIQMQMHMLSELEKTDPEKFENIMSEMEEDMAKEAKKQGIDMDEVNRKYDEQMEQQAMNDSISSNDVKLPGGQKVMDAQGKGTRAKQEGICITPKAHFAIKTKDEGGNKVFINVCSDDNLAEPGPQIKLDDDGNEVEGIRVPVAVGEERRQKDEDENITRTFDCIVNSKVIVESEEDKTGQYRDWICQLFIQYVEQKFKAQLDKRYKLPKLKYHAYVNKTSGEIVPKTHEDAEISKQWIRDTKKEPKISEVKSSKKKNDQTRPAPTPKNSAANPAIPKIPMSSKKIPMTINFLNGDGDNSLTNILDFDFGPRTSTPSLLLSDLATANVDNLTKSQCLMEPALVNYDRETHAVTHCIIVASLPSDSGPNAEVDVSAVVCSVAAPGFLKTEAILPFPVDWKSASCSYMSASKELTVKVKICEEVDIERDADVGSRQWQLAHALGGSGSGSGSGDKKGEENEKGKGKKKRGENPSQTETEESLAEDKFHLNLPKNYNLNTGNFQSEDVSDDENDTGEQAYPEDAFHATDIMSQHIIDQQKKERDEKVNKGDKERAERKKAKKEGNNEEDIEYLDVDDFKVGGKYYSGGLGGSKKDEPGNSNAVDDVSSDLGKAMEYLKVGKGEEGEVEVEVGVEVVEESSSSVKLKPKLSSKMWTELLD